MIILQSENRYRKLALLDIESGHLEWQSRNKKFDPPLNSIQGTFSKIGRHTLYLYRYNNALHFRVDKKDLVLTDDVVITLENLRCRRRRLSVLKNGQNVVEPHQEKKYNGRYSKNIIGTNFCWI